jgi:formate-dependent nitrite reductase membrane component NrfD
MASYWAGGTLLVAASIFNPISPSLILASGASSGFAAMAGLVLIPRLVERQVSAASGGDGVLARSTGWIVVGIIVAVAFVGVIGRGIAFGGS